MKKQIWKFPYQQEIRMPKGAEVISASLQHEAPMIWAIVDPSASKTTRYFKIFGTGWEFETNEYPIKQHIGTIQSLESHTIWHVFEIQKP